MKRVAQWYLVSCFRQAEDKVLNDLKTKLTAYNYITVEENVDKFASKLVQGEDYEIVTEDNGLHAVKLTTVGQDKAGKWILDSKELFDKYPTALKYHKVEIKDIQNAINGSVLYPERKVTLTLFKKLENHVTPSGKNKLKEVNLFPGYIFINLVMLDNVWYLIRNTQKVTGFIGSSGRGAKPIPLQEEEIDRLLKNFTSQAIGQSTLSGDTSISMPTEKVVETITYKADFEVGDNVQIVSGAFLGQNARVRSIDEKKGVAVVEIEFLGRITTAEFEFNSLKKN